MSSEAAYFSDALTGTPEMLELGHPPSEVFSEPHKGSEFPTEQDQSAGAVISVSAISDELLLEQVCQGDREALSLLFRRHARAVRNVAHRILRDEAEADDLVQEVFLFIFRKASLYDSARGTAWTWMIHVAYHRAFDRRRYLISRRFYGHQELDESALHLIDSRRALPFHEQSIEGVIGRELMARFDARLTPEQRETIQLYFFEGYTLKEIAQLTGRSLVNVRSHYYRGLERLRKYVLPEKMRSK
jgi:RNA polymerase sigma-70 factor (ECF subfamily)